MSCSSEFPLRVRSQQLVGVVATVVLGIAAPSVVHGQTQTDSTPARPVVNAAAAALPGVIDLCIVNGSGTAYRVGAAGLPAQCFSSAHTPLSLNLTGPQGERGLKGDSGAVGALGPAGAAGSNGTAGAVGPVGPAGANGVAGAAGMAGAVGATGPIGPVGLAGAAGANGAQGNTGATGLAGPIGPIGLTGVTGPAGPIGITGLTGGIGANGAIGPQGPMGLIGPAGGIGPIGPDGVAGVAGPVGPVGPAGALGPAGPAGLNGIPGVDGAVGPIGPIGIGGIGPNGQQGPQGMPGLQGPAGTTDHAALTNLTADSHLQYLRTDGTRGLTGPLATGGFKLTGLGAATTAGDAVRYEQAIKNGETAAGDLGGTFPNPIVQKLQGRAMLSTAPNASEVLAWNGTAWAPAAAVGGGASVHSALTGLTADDHPQYLLAGTRVTNNGFVVTGTQNQGAAVPSGAGTRMVWNSRKGAFRAGTVVGIGANEWNDDQVGYNSTAFGENTRASGTNSLASGYRSFADGLESVAFGNEAQASGQASFALNGHATGYMSMAVGNSTYATGSAALALGQQAYASGNFAIAIGRSQATNNSSIAIGTDNQASADHSIAIGNSARTENFTGSVVISAGWVGNFGYLNPVLATAANQFVVRADGGTIIYSSDNLATGVSLAQGGGSWDNISDRNKKENFRSVEGEQLLAQLRAIPVSSWNYKAQNQSIRHVGPMAQEWQRTMQLNADSTTINSGDIAGATLAGVQALDARTTASAARVVALEARIRELEQQMNALLQSLRVPSGNTAAKQP